MELTIQGSEPAPSLAVDFQPMTVNSCSTRRHCIDRLNVECIAKSNAVPQDARLYQKVRDRMLAC